MGHKVATIKRIVRRTETEITAEVEVPRSGTFRINIPDTKHHCVGRLVPVSVTQAGRKMNVKYAG